MDSTASSPPREFAVLVPILVHEGEECVLLTKRPENLDRYAGQVSLPGGERDPLDKDLKETALRETREEVGIPPERVEILRELGWHETSLLHRVKPFVGRVRAPCSIVPDPLEVEIRSTANKWIGLRLNPTRHLRADPKPTLSRTRYKPEERG